MAVRQLVQVAKLGIEHFYLVGFCAIRYATEAKSFLCRHPIVRFSKHLDQLEKKGLISRSLDPKDTRRIRLTLTKDGKRVTRELTPIFTSLVGERLARIPAARRKVFLAVLAELADAYQP